MRQHLVSLRSLIRNDRGNVAVIFALACLPLLAAVGCAIDYAMATQLKSKLQGAADAASVGSLATGSPAYVAAGTMLIDGSIPAGTVDAKNIFDANVKGLAGISNLQTSFTVTKNGINLNSIATFSASMPTTFLNVIGFPTISFSGQSTSQSSLPKFLDFYLALDVSGSMGLPSTPSEQARLAAVNPDMYRDYPTGCQLGCHFVQQNSNCADYGQGYPTNNYCLGYMISRVSQSGYNSLLKNSGTTLKGKQLPPAMVAGLPASLNLALPPVSSCSTPGTDSCIQLRSDAVGYAVTQLLATANSSSKIAQQYRIGLYPFIQYLHKTYFPLTASINGSPTNPATINYAAANLASVLDTNADLNLGSGGTHIDTALASLNSMILSVGDGSTLTRTLPYVFLVTDGAQDPQIKGVPNGAWSGSNQATTINPTTDCGPLKARGIMISVLYIPYQPISPANPTFAGGEDIAANNNIPFIPASLQGCASPGFFYTANTPADIALALNAMFNQAVATARVKS